MNQANQKRLVFQYKDGNFYQYRGESTACNVKHITTDLARADDFSQYVYPWKVLDFKPSQGNFYWVNVVHTLDKPYNPKRLTKKFSLGRKYDT